MTYSNKNNNEIIHENLSFFSIFLKSYFTINIFTSGLFVSFITKVQDTSKVQRQLREILCGNATVTKADFSNSNRKNSNSNCLPSHVFLDAKYCFFIPVDRALRVLLEIMKSAKVDYHMQTKVFSNLELHTFTMSKSGANLYFIFLLIFVLLYYFLILCHLQFLGLLSPWESSLKPIQALFRKILKLSSADGKDLCEEELHAFDGVPSPVNVKNRRNGFKNDENRRDSVRNSVYQSSDRNDMGIGEAPHSSEKRLLDIEKSLDSNTVNMHSCITSPHIS
jgi:hypothetical protein